jgi:hypothetical protein
LRTPIRLVAAPTAPLTTTAMISTDRTRLSTPKAATHGERSRNALHEFATRQHNGVADYARGLGAQPSATRRCYVRRRDAIPAFRKRIPYIHGL